MQLLIDTANENARSIRLSIAVLSLVATELERDGVPLPELTHDSDAALNAAVAGRPGVAALVEAARPVPRPTPPPVAPTPPAPDAPPLPPDNVPPAPIEHPPVHPDAAPIVPAGTPDVDPSTLGFGTGATAPVAPAAPNAGAPAAAHQAATAPAIASLAVAAERDTRNLPWDARIHSETKKKNADGTWRYRRNLDPAVKASVDAELLAAYGAPQVTLSPSQPAAVVHGAVPVPPAPAAVPQPPAAATGVPVPPAPAAGNVPAPPAPVSLQPSNVLPFTGAPGVPVPPATAVGVPDAGQQGVVPAPVTSFRELMTKVNTALQGGRLTQQQITDACKSAQVDSLTALASQPMLVPTVDAYLNRIFGGAAA